MSPTGSRLSAISLLVLALLLGYVYGVEPLVLRYLETREAIEAQLFNIERLRALKNRKHEAQARLAALRREAALRPVWLPQASSGVALAALQERIGRLVRRHGGAVLSMSEAKSQPQDPLVPVSIRASARMTTAALQRVLHEIEGGAPVLVVDAVSIRRARARAQGPAQVDQLDAQLRITGFMPDAKVPE